MKVVEDERACLVPINADHHYTIQGTFTKINMQTLREYRGVG